MEISESERLIIQTLNHPQYSVEYLEEWLNRKDVERPMCLMIMGAKGFYQAVQSFDKMIGKVFKEIAENEIGRCN